MKHVLTAGLVLGLSGCAAPAHPDKVADAVTAPLSDLNLLKAAIPPVLQVAAKQPYVMPDDWSCTTLAADVAALDEVLPSDFGTPAPPQPGLIEKGTQLAGNTALGTLRGMTEGVIPFRSWVRKLTGAERHSQEVAAAIAAGNARRSFLKGLAASRACYALPEPAKPTPSTPQPEG